MLRWIAVAILVSATPLHAQEVRGRLTDAHTGAAIDRAFLVLLSETGVELNRVLTSETGEFSVRAPGPGVYRLRSERIGFESTTSDPLVLADGDSRQLRITVAPVVVRLDTLRVEDDSRECRVYREQGLATAKVWEEARKLLAAVAWNESTAVFRYDTRTYKHRLNDRMRTIDGTETLQAGLPKPPYRSVPVDQLQRHGYAFVSRDSIAFYAPDARQFFSDEFLERHCFHLTTDDDHPGFVGLEFEPVTGSDVTDVRGVFWLDRVESEVRWLDLYYTNVRPLMLERGSRGRVEFLQVATGPWFVSRWWIRVPRVRLPHPLMGRSRSRWVADGFVEVGGEVMKVFDEAGNLLFAVEP